MASFVLNFWLTEFLLSMSANRLELRCEPIEIGWLECVVDHVARHNYAEPIWLTLVGKSVGRLL